MLEQVLCIAMTHWAYKLWCNDRTDMITQRLHSPLPCLHINYPTPTQQSGISSRLASVRHLTSGRLLQDLYLLHSQIPLELLYMHLSSPNKSSYNNVNATQLVTWLFKPSLCNRRWQSTARRGLVQRWWQWGRFCFHLWSPACCIPKESSILLCDAQTLPPFFLVSICVSLLMWFVCTEVTHAAFCIVRHDLMRRSIGKAKITS